MAQRSPATRLQLGALLCAAVAVAPACTDDPLILAVDLKTDLRAPAELSTVDVSVVGGGETSDAHYEVGLDPGSFVTGRRVAEIGGLDPGTYDVTVGVRDAAGAPVAARLTRVVMERNTIVTVVIARDCRGVECPGPGDPASHTACHGNVCVDPSCSPETPDLCESECSTAADCIASSCATGACTSGVCLFEPAPELCGPGGACDVDRGCSERSDFAEPGTTMWMVPPGCTSLTVRAWGAGGGRGALMGATPGAGGYASGILSATPGDILTVVVGAPGGVGGEDGGAGGELGGGEGGGGARDSFGGGGGGGFSGVFRGSVMPWTAMVVAGGGGGAHGALGSGAAGAGGGESGEAAGDGVVGAPGGTQTEGGRRESASGSTAGAALSGGRGEIVKHAFGGGGGGAGWFGGSGGLSSTLLSGSGGGGSGFVMTGATSPLLATGTGPTPALASASERGGAADPGAPGRVLLDCSGP